MNVLTAAIRRAERNAIFSSCCGVTGEVILTDSAVIILYAGLLGAGDSLSLMTTAVLPLLNGILILPMAGIAPFCGSRKLVLNSNFLALGGYLAVVAAPFAGSFGISVLLGGVFIFSVCQTGFVAGWFPLLDTFLIPERRTFFLGRMRFWHQVTAIGFLGVLSFLIGKNPGIKTLQAALFIGGCIFAGRLFFIMRITAFPEKKQKIFSWRKGLFLAARNRLLRSFSFYSFLLNCAMFGVVPLMLLYLKNAWDFPDGELVLVSAAAFAGMPAGYLIAHYLEKRTGTRQSFLFLNLLLSMDLLLLFFLPPGGTVLKITVAICLMVCNFCIAANSVITGGAMMAMASPGNKVMAMAFWGAFYYGGSGISRLGASLLLGSEKFTEYCRFWGVDQYHGLLAVFILLAISGIFLLPRRFTLLGG